MYNITIIILLIIPSCLFGQDVYFKWGKTINSPGTESIVYAEDKAGNYYAGITIPVYGSNVVDIDPGQGVYLAKPFTSSYICKLDMNMDLIWAKPFEGIPISPGTLPVYPGVNIEMIKLDNDSNIIIAGRFGGVVDFDPGPGVFYLSNEGYAKAFLCKLDKNGNLKWVRKYPITEYGYIADITVDSENNIIVYSSFRGIVDVGNWPNPYILTGSPGYGDLYIFKVNFYGKVEWGHVIGGEWTEYPSKVKVDENDDLYFSGTFDSPVDFDPGPDSALIVPEYNLNGGSRNSFLFKLTKSGAFRWVKNYKFARVSEFIISRSEVLLVGSFYLYTDFNPGAGDSILNPANGKLYLSKIDTSGNFDWVKQFGDGDNLSLALDNSGNFYISGSFSDQVDFDPGSGTAYLTAPSYNPWDPKKDIFILKLDNTGSFVWVKQIKSENDIDNSNISVHQSGDILVSGQYKGTIDLNPHDSIQYNVNSSGYYDVFLMKLSEVNSVGMPDTYNIEIKIYPNPTTGKFQIDHFYKGELIVTIYDITGKAISEKVINASGKAELEIEGNPGIYFIEIMTEQGERQVIKVVKM